MKVLERFLLVAAMLLVAGCGQDAGRDQRQGDAGGQQWKFAIEEIEGSVQHRYAMEFKKRVEARSDGRIEVIVYPYGQLGTSAQLTELVQLGSVQFAMASPGHLGAVIPEVQLFSLHFVFSDDETVNQAVLSDNAALQETLQEAYGDVNLTYLGAFQEGWMAWTANRPIMTPAAFRGVKIRVMNSPLLLQAYELYGASAVTLPYSQVYSALQLNMIDAQVNPVFAIEEMSFYEVQTHMMMANHLPFITTVISNPQFLDSLSGEDRDLVLAVLEELEDYIFDVQRTLNAERLAEIRTNSDIEIMELGEVQRAAFREESLPIRDAYVERAGPRGAKLLDILTDAIARAGEKPPAKDGPAGSPSRK